MTLRRIIFLPLLAMSVLMAAYLYLVRLPAEMSRSESNYIHSTEHHLQTVATSLVPLLLERQLDAVYGNLDALLKDQDDWVHLELNDAQGRVLYPLGVSEAGRQGHAGHDIRVIRREVHHLNRHLGELVLRLDVVNSLEEVKKRYLALFSLLLAAVATALFLTGMVLDRLVRRPVQILVDAARKLATGDFDAPLPRAGSCEMGTLVRSFGGMRDSVRLKSKNLNEANEQLRFEVEAHRSIAKELRESEERFKNMAAMLPQIVFETDMKGNYVFANRFSLEVSGYTETDMKEGLNAMQLFVPGDRPRAYANMQRRLRGEDLGSVEYTAMRKDGTVFPVLLFADPIVRGGVVTGLRGIAIDISERKKTEALLRDREAQLREAQRLGHMGSWHLDLVGNRLEWSDEVFRIFEIDPQRFGASYDAFLQAIHPDDREMVNQAYSNSLRTGRPYEVEHRLQMPDGRIKFVLEQGETVYDAAGKPLKSLGTIQDITERKLAEDAIRRMNEELEKRVQERTMDLREALHSLQVSELKWKTLVNTAGDGILLADIDTQEFVDANDAICRMLGYSREELLLLGVRDVHMENDLAFAGEQFRLLVEGGQKTTFDIPYKKKDGTVFYAEVSGSPVFLENRQYLMGVIRDITARKQMEEQLREAREELARKEKLTALGQLAGTVGHELRNPLAVMNNAVYFLKSVLSGADATVREYLGILKGEIENSERIISDLLDFSRTRKPQTQPVDVRDLIEQSCGRCAIPEIVSLRWDIPEDLPQASADPRQMEQVFQNLVTNAVQAMPAGGELRINARVVAREQGGDRVAVSVADTGEGISSENMLKLFQPLFTTKIRGVGLGLVASKNITEANGGAITVQSEQGKGTTFTVTLPCEQA